jgi:hypothetical protein
MDWTYVPENNPVIESWVTKSNDTSLRRAGLSKYQPAPQLLQSVNTRLGQKRPRIGKETYSRKRARATVIRATPPRKDEDAGEAKEAGDLTDKGHEDTMGADPIFEEEHTDDAGTQHDGYAAGDATDNGDAPLEEKHYEIEFNCTGKYRIKVAGLNLPEWNELPSVQSFSYSSEDISVKDVVIAIVNESNDESIAEVRQIKSSHDNYFVLIFWYYTC